MSDRVSGAMRSAHDNIHAAMALLPRESPVRNLLRFAAADTRARVWVAYDPRILSARIDVRNVLGHLPAESPARSAVVAALGDLDVAVRANDEQSARGGI